MKMNVFSKLTLLAGLMLFLAVGCEKEQPNGPDQPIPDTPVAENGDPIELEDFTVTLTSLHSGDVFLNIAPEDQTMKYWYSLVIKEEMPEDDQSVYDADLEYFNIIADYYGLSLEEMLSQNLVNSDVDWRYNGLEARTEYVLYMYGLNVDGTPLTAVNRLTFTTKAVEKLECDFDIIVGDNVGATSFSVSIIPSDDRVGYFFDVFPASMYEEYCLSDAENLPAFIAEYIPALAAEAGYTVPATVGIISNYGAVAHDFTAEDGIEASNTYYVFAIGLGADGTAVTDAEVVAVTTQRPPVNTFEVLPGSIEDDRATFYVSPDHNESYVALFELQEYMYDEEGNPLTDEEIIDAILYAQGDKIGYHVYSGRASISECPLIPNKDYYCLVFGYFGGEVTTPLTKVAFQTKPADASECDFVITVGTPTTTTCSVSFDPYITPTPHMFNYMPYSTYRAYGANDDAVKRYNDELIDSLWDPAKMSREEWLSRALETDYNSWTIEGLEPNTKYVVYVIGMVPDGTYTTAAFTREFTTQEIKEGPHVKEILFNANRSEGYISCWIYFDLDTEVKHLRMSHIVNDDTVYNLSDEELIDYLMEDNDSTFVQEITNQTYISIYDQHLTVGDTVYYAGAVYDEAGNWRIYRETYTL